MTPYRHLLLRGLRVSHGNAQPAPWIVSGIAMTAYAGFVGALCRRLGVQHAGFAVIHHDHQLLAEELEGRIYPHQPRAASWIDKDDCPQGSGVALSIQPTVRCHAEVTIVVRFHEDAEVSADGAGSFLQFGRLAGGSITSVTATDIVEDASDADIMAAVGSGFAIVDRRDLVSTRQPGMDPLDAILWATDPRASCHWPLKGAAPLAFDDLLQKVAKLAPVSTLDAGRLLQFVRDGLHRYDADHRILKALKLPDADADALRDAARQDRAWLVPNCIGYVLLCEPAVRPGARADLPHAYAESLVGLTQFRSIRGATKLPWWRMTNPHPRAFALATQP